MSPDPILIHQAPPLAGLSFRHFQGESDYAGLAAVLVASENADRIDRQVAPETLAQAYQRLTNCDPARDMILAEVEGQLVGYSRGWWWDESTTGRLYGLSGFLVPAWRRKGIGTVLLQWTEARLRQVAAEHPRGLPKSFQVDVMQSQTGRARLLEENGYRAVRYFYEMVRPRLEEIPDGPLPEGLELRPVTPAHYRALWQSVDETSRDEWGYTKPTEQGYQEWLASPHFQPQLWQVAWDKAANRIVGHVLTFIDEKENTQFRRQRGYTEGVGVDSTWRRRGLARALIVQSLRVQKAAGMSESAMAVDSDSLHGATRLYESLGFQVLRRNAIYRKAL